MISSVDAALYNPAIDQKLGSRPLEQKVDDVSGILSKPIESLTISPLSDRKIVDQRLAELKEKDSHLWICVSRKEGPHGGFLYGFSFREEFKNNAELRLKKRAEIYPAVEPSFKEFEDKLNAHRVLHILGFSVEKTTKSSIIYIPDQQAILAGWSQVKSHRLEQFKKLTEKIKILAQEKNDFVTWEQGFMAKVKQVYLRYRMDSFDYMSEVRKLIQEQWSDTWNVNVMREYIRAIYDFCRRHLEPIFIKRLFEPNVNPDDPATYDGIWDHVTSSEVEFFLETKLEILESEYGLDSDLIKDVIDHESSLESLKERIRLPELFLDYGEGIANDWDFVKSYLNFDVLVSKNKEFIHDVFFHLIPVLEDKSWASSPKRMVKFDNEKNVIANLFLKLETVKKCIESKSGDIKVTLSDVEKLMLTLSVYVDGYRNGTLGEHGIEGVIQVWNRNSAGFNLTYKIWNERYPDEDLDINSLQNALKIVLQYPV